MSHVSFFLPKWNKNFIDNGFFFARNHWAVLRIKIKIGLWHLSVTNWAVLKIVLSTCHNNADVGFSFHTHIPKTLSFLLAQFSMYFSLFILLNWILYLEVLSVCICCKCIHSVYEIFCNLIIQFEFTKKICIIMYACVFNINQWKKSYSRKCHKSDLNWQSFSYEFENYLYKIYTRFRKNLFPNINKKYQEDNALRKENNLRGTKLM